MCTRNKQPKHYDVLCLLPPILLMLWSLGYCPCDSTPLLPHGFTPLKDVFDVLMFLNDTPKFKLNGM